MQTLHKNMEKREWKNLIKYNLLSLFIFISSVLIGFAIAGNVFVTNGNVETDSGLNVSNILFVNASTKNVGIGISNPGHNLTVIGDINFTGKIY